MRKIVITESSLTGVQISAEGMVTPMDAIGLLEVAKAIVLSGLRITAQKQFESPDNSGDKKVVAHG